MTKKCTFCYGEYLGQAGAKLELCEACRTKLGLIEMPPLSRPPRPCARCNGRKFVRVIPREHTSAQSGEVNTQISAPMLLTHVPEVHRGWLLNYAKELDMGKGYGRLEIFVCHGCGDVEWFCPDVSSIPIDPMLMTELVDYDADKGPYR